MQKDAVLGLADPAVLLLSVGVNALEYYNLLTSMVGPNETATLKNQLESVKTTSGIDLEKEVLANVGGNLNFGMYDGSSVTMSNYNTLLTLNVKDEAIMKGVIDKALKLLPADQQAMIKQEQVGGVNTYVMNAGMVQMYLTLKDQQVLLASSKPIFEKALNGKAAAGFAANLADQELKAKLMGADNLFYFNIDEAVKIVKNFEMFLGGAAGSPENFQKMLDAAGKFEYLLNSSKLDGDTLSAQMMIKTRFAQPFFGEVANLVKSFNTPPAATPAQ